MAEAAVLCTVGVAFALVVFRLFRKRGKGGCSCGCGACGRRCGNFRAEE